MQSLYRHKYTLVAAKSSRNSLVYFTGIATVNKKPYTDILRRLRDGVKKQRPQIWRTNSWFHLHDNAPAHQSASVKEQCDSIIIPYNLLTWLQLIFTCSLDWNQHWRDDTFVMLLASLRMRRKRLSQQVFQECFQQIYMRCQKFRVAQGVQFWRNCSLNYCTVLYFSEIKWLQKHSDATTYEGIEY
jgi:hypothetical protein